MTRLELQELVQSNRAARDDWWEGRVPGHSAILVVATEEQAVQLLKQVPWSVLREASYHTVCSVTETSLIN